MKENLKVEDLKLFMLFDCYNTKYTSIFFTFYLLASKLKRPNFTASHEYTPPEMQFNPAPVEPAQNNNLNQQQQQQQSYNSQMAEQADRLADLLRANLDSIEGLTEAKVKFE